VLGLQSLRASAFGSAKEEAMLNLGSHEEELLLEILEEHHRTLVMEIARTDHHDFKAVLRKKADLLDSILTKLRSHELAAA
jgi:hypothetical protein